MVVKNQRIEEKEVFYLYVDHPTRRCRVYKMLELVCSKCIEEVACGSAISVKQAKKGRERSRCVLVCLLSALYLA